MKTNESWSIDLVRSIVSNIVVAERGQERASERAREGERERMVAIGSPPNAVGKINRSLRHEFLSKRGISICGDQKETTLTTTGRCERLETIIGRKDDRPPTSAFTPYRIVSCLEFT